MKLRSWLLLALICSTIIAHAQNHEIDSLKNLLKTAEDINRVNVFENLSYAYLSSSADSALKYALDGLQLAKDINSPKGEAICLDALGNVYFHIGDNAKALEYYLEYMKLKEELKDLDNISVAYYNIAGVYVEDQDYKHALFYLFKAKDVDEKAKDSSALLYDNYSLASAYSRMGRQDSALLYIRRAYNLMQQLHDKDMPAAILNVYAEIYLAAHDTTRADNYYRLSIPYAEAIEDNEVLVSNYYGLAQVFDERSIPDSAIAYALKGLTLAKQGRFFKQVLDITSFLSGVFKNKKVFDSAFYYQELSIAIKDSLFNVAQVRKLQDLKFSEQQRQQSIETAQLKYQNRVRLIVVIAAALVLLIIAVLLWRNNRQKQAANILLQQQKEKVESALNELRLTQAQLIQSEKMASLGVLTAGIAHEIQNPLNFVNNFSEVNAELIRELKAEHRKPLDKRDLELENDVLDDLEVNEEKVTLHGRRASSIVKSMLQHSRTSTGQREPTDINALADEYLRLSYHGMRAKDKSFTVALETHFDPALSLPQNKLNVVPQDIGRVLLNLYNNAFYAVSAKAPATADAVSEKLVARSLQLDANSAPYVPTVTVATKKLNDRIEISVKDNGSGIPQNIVDKIFQPFFTTKPTGQGTGLGLSLSYDIIKAHGGEIKAETAESGGTEFIIQLPA